MGDFGRENYKEKSVKIEKGYFDKSMTHIAIKALGSLKGEIKVSFSSMLMRAGYVY